jgi:neurotransmitter:Na+ symporter, NSS family
LQQQGGITRARAAVLACGLAWLVGIGSVLSFNLWSAWRPLAFVPSLAQMTFFEAMDYLGGSILLLIGAFFTSLFFGWRLSRTILAEELDATTPLARQVCVWLLRYLCPIAILAIFVSVIL